MCDIPEVDEVALEYHGARYSFVEVVLLSLVIVADIFLLYPG